MRKALVSACQVSGCHLEGDRVTVHGGCCSWLLKNPGRCQVGQLSADNVMVSFDVVSLFTRVPVDKAIDTINSKLELDEELARSQNHLIKGTDLLPYQDLSTDHLLSVPRLILRAGGRSCHGFSTISSGGKPIYGSFQGESIVH